MANGQLKPVATLLLVLNFCMYVIVLGIGGWAMNYGIDHGFIIGPRFNLPAHFSPIYFPMGNAATGFFCCVCFNFWCCWSCIIPFFAWKEIELQLRNARLVTMEAFLIILCFTQLVYIAAIHGASTRR
ncbi:unnamed protein product [Withania somnifera]